jgi:hypothetical protein
MTSRETLLAELRRLRATEEIAYAIGNIGEALAALRAANAVTAQLNALSAMHDQEPDHD